MNPSQLNCSEIKALPTLGLTLFGIDMKTPENFLCKNDKGVIRGFR
jgi:hypothetical protein